MTQSEDALKKAQELVQAQNGPTNAAASALGLKIGTALQGWFKENLTGFVVQHRSQFDKLTDGELALLKTRLNAVSATWPDGAQELAVNEYKLASPERNASLSHFLWKISDDLLQDANGTLTEVGGLMIKFSIDRVDGTLPDHYLKRLQPELEEFVAQYRKQRELLETQRKWEQRVEAQRIAKRWEDL